MRKTDDWIKNFLKLTSGVEVPEAFLEWTAVSTIAAALQRKVYYKRGSLITFGNLYIFLVGPASVGKGVSMSMAQDLMEGVNISFAPDTTTLRGLIMEFSRQYRESMGDLDMIGDDGDINDKNIVHVPHASLTLWSPEILRFLSTDVNDKFIGALCDIYDSGMAKHGPFVDVTAQHGRVELENIWFNLIGGTTPETLQGLIQRNIVGSGLNSRIIYVYGARKRHYVAFPEELNKDLQDRLTSDLIDINKLSGEFKKDSKYIEKYSEWYLHNVNPDNYPLKGHKFAAYCDRRCSLHLPKIAMIISASESDDMIMKEEHFDRAKELLERTEKWMPAIFGGMGELGLRGLVHYEIRDRLKYNKELSYNRLFQEHIADVEEDSLWLIVTMIKQLGECELVPMMGVQEQRGFCNIYDVPYKLDNNGKATPQTARNIVDALRSNNYRLRKEARDWKLKSNIYEGEE